MNKLKRRGGRLLSPDMIERIREKLEENEGCVTRTKHDTGYSYAVIKKYGNDIIEKHREKNAIYVG